LWIPAGLAHGFLVTSESADFLYKTTDYYAQHAEGSVRWDDPALGITWPTAGLTISLSAKDSSAPVLNQLQLDTPH
jgi:dTDP-4-dehydrorhamnose 3,5-epimerase